MTKTTAKLFFTGGYEVSLVLDNGEIYGTVTRNEIHIVDGWYNGMTIADIVKHTITEYDVVFLDYQTH